MNMKHIVQEAKFQALLNLYSEVDSIVRTMESIEDKESEEFKVAANTLLGLQSLLSIAENKITPNEWELYYAWLPF